MKENGILDPKGKFKNPLTGKKYSERYFDLAEGWSKLPMYKEAKNIISLIRKHRVLVLESGTGTGKTVILPKLALHALDYKGKVVMTVPKQAPARSNAVYAAMCLDVELGQEVGYQYSGASITSSFIDEYGIETVEETKAKSKKTKLLFSTEGSVVMQINNDPSLKEFDIVIIDEAHERTVDIDILLLLLREALILNPKLKIIITSATLPEGLFENYFKERNIDVAEKKVAPVPNFPVEIYYSEDEIRTKERNDAGLDTLKREIIDLKQVGDVISFVTSLNTGLANCMELKKYKDIYCMAVSSKSLGKNPDLELIAGGKKDLEQISGSPYFRKVIFSTNVWESSVTLPTIKYVIDNGIELSSSYDPERMEDQLLTQNISQAQAAQRKGRAGRTFPGICYRLYTEEEFEKMRPNPIVPIRKSDITDRLLNLLNRDDIKTLGDLINFLRLFIEKPPKIFVVNAIRNLFSWGLIDSNSNIEGKLTEKGKIVNYINGKKVNNINCSIALYYSIIYKCSSEMSVMAAILTIMAQAGPEDLFNSPNDPFLAKKYKQIYTGFKRPEGDLFTLFEIIQKFLQAKWTNENDIIEWCEKYFINSRMVLNIIERAKLIYKNMPRKIEEEKEFIIPDLKDRVRFCLLKGYFFNLAEMKKKKKKIFYRNFYPMKKTSAPLDDKSYVKESNFIIYNNLSFRGNKRNFYFITKMPKKIIDMLSDFEKSQLGWSYK